VVLIEFDSLDSGARRARHARLQGGAQDGTGNVDRDMRVAEGAA
jgi:hypothetical protein